MDQVGLEAARDTDRGRAGQEIEQSLSHPPPRLPSKLWGIQMMLGRDGRHQILLSSPQQSRDDVLSTFYCCGFTRSWRKDALLPLCHPTMAGSTAVVSMATRALSCQHCCPPSFRPLCSLLGWIYSSLQPGSMPEMVPSWQRLDGMPSLALTSSTEPNASLDLWTQWRHQTKRNQTTSSHF